MYKPRYFLPQALSFYCKFQTLNRSLPLIQVICKEYQNFLALRYILRLHKCFFDLYRDKSVQCKSCGSGLLMELNHDNLKPSFLLTLSIYHFFDHVSEFFTFRMFRIWNIRRFAEIMSLPAKFCHIWLSYSVYLIRCCWSIYLLYALFHW